MADEILVRGAIEKAEVIGEDIQEFECSCGFKLQLSGGIALNDGLNFVRSGAQYYSCPICSGGISIGHTNG